MIFTHREKFWCVSLRMKNFPLQKQKVIIQSKCIMILRANWSETESKVFYDGGKGGDVFE